MGHDAFQRQILSALPPEDQQRVTRLFPALYGELREIAGAVFQGEARAQTLQPTAVVHEAYLKLAAADGTAVRSREHFLALAARVMRQVLTDRARSRLASKRGGDRHRVTLSGVPQASGALGVDIVELDDALTRLESLHERQAQIVEMRFFGGLTIAEAADVLGVTERTANSDWRVARAWLDAELFGSQDDE